MIRVQIQGDFTLTDTEAELLLFAISGDFQAKVLQQTTQAGQPVYQEETLKSIVQNLQGRLAQVLRVRNGAVAGAKSAMQQAQSAPVAEKPEGSP